MQQLVRQHLVLVQLGQSGTEKRKKKTPLGQVQLELAKVYTEKTSRKSPLGQVTKLTVIWTRSW